VRSFSRIRPRRTSAARPPFRKAVRPDAAAENVVALITACIAEVRAAGFAETAEILAIARIDLLARLYGVSEEELECIIAAAPLKAETPKAASRKKRAKKPAAKPRPT